ncbi:MAG: type IX secretion system sortase PorU [Candidatus Kapabacteria bacterium]|nr:type IX secretion system sortase PorU [Candidatus Kapabacteria bacterium]
MLNTCSCIASRAVLLWLFVGLSIVGASYTVSAQSPQVPSISVSTPDNWSWCGITVVESSPMRLVLDYTPQVKGFDTVRIDGKNLLRPKILGAALESSHIGAPLSAELRVPITVPSPNGFGIASYSARSVKSTRSLMAPRLGINKKGEPEYRLLNDIYAAETMPEWCNITYSGIGRDRHVATLKLRAARYNPETSSIEIPQTMRIVVEFTPEGISQLVPQEASTKNTKTGFVSTINHAQTDIWRVVSNSGASSTAASLGSSIAPPPDLMPSKKGSTLQAVSGRWLKIGVERDGIYRITAQQLRDAGLTVANSEVPSISLFGNGGTELPERVSLSAANTMNEQPLIVETDAGGALVAISFFGAAPNGFVALPASSASQAPTIQHFVNTYSRRNYYMLNVGSTTQGRRVTFAESPVQATITPSYHISRVFKDDDLVNPFDVGLSGSGRRWFGQNFTNNRATRFETALPNLVRNAVPVNYRISAAWNNPSGIGVGGKIYVREGSTELFATPFDFFGSGDDYTVGTVTTRSATASSSLIQNNRSILEFLYVSNSGDDSHGILDWFEIHYPREFVAADNQLNFFTDTPENFSGVAEYTVRGFSANQIYVVDVSNRANPQFIRNLSQIGGQATFRAAIAPQAPRNFYLSSQTASVASIERADDVADLRDAAGGADLIVITDKDLLPSAEAYRTYRQAQSGLAVRIVTTDQIYYQFNGGTPDPTALRDYIAFAYRMWAKKPSYVLFWGDGHFDYRSLTPGITAKNFVPTHQTYDADGDMNSVNTNIMTEDYFVCVNGDDDLVDMALGRLCVRSNDEGATILSKIRRYETASSVDNWRTQLLLTADDAPTKSLANSDRSLHTGQSEDLANFILPIDVRQHKTYLPDFPPENSPGGRRRPAATQDMIAAVNEGVLIFNWIGHGNPRLWANEDFLLRDLTIPQFTNLDRLFFLVAATCDFGRFDNFREQSGAEEMISSPRGGAIATFAAGRTVYAVDNAAISQELFRQIFRNTSGEAAPRLGDLLFRVKQTFFSGSYSNDRKFCLLGDPTVRLALPEQPVIIDTLNSLALQSTTAQPQVKALSQLSVSGFIASPSSQSVDASFTGSILASLYDTDIQKAITDIDLDRTIHRFNTLGGLLNIGASQVRNGRFSFTMPIPKDISFSNQTGRLFLYAVSADGRKFGRGATIQFTVGGIDETAVNDGIGPEIRLFMDERTFRAGDFVSTTPTLLADLYDATGVNATGTGIGHDIQCWVDNSPIPITLTQSYRISLDDPRRGTVERILPSLAPGLHRVKVRAWDIFNNYSESETYFRVIGADSSLVLAELVNYPNPFTEATTIRFRHNQSTAQPYSIGIYSALGVPVKVLTGTTTARTMEVLWDGRDESGSTISSGVYLYQVRVSGADGQTQSASRGFVKVR